MTELDIAKICHEMNRFYCEGTGDNSQLPWAHASDWQKLSAWRGVRFTLDHPTAGPSESHENWMKEKLADGWTYGPVKDPVKKEHPCIVPYAELPAEQQMKAELFVIIVHVMKPALSF